MYTKISGQERKIRDYCPEKSKTYGHLNFVRKWKWIFREKEGGRLNENKQKVMKEREKNVRKS